MWFFAILVKRKIYPLKNKLKREQNAMQSRTSGVLWAMGKENNSNSVIINSMILDMFNRDWKSQIKTHFDNRIFLSKKEFIKKMLSNGYDILSIESAYDKISDYLPSGLIKNIYPDDDLIAQFKIDDEDLGDILLEISKELKFEFPSIEEQKKFYKHHDDSFTMERMIQFIDYFMGLSSNKRK